MQLRRCSVSGPAAWPRSFPRCATDAGTPLGRGPGAKFATSEVPHRRRGAARRDDPGWSRQVPRPDLSGQGPSRGRPGRPGRRTARGLTPLFDGQPGDGAQQLLPQSLQCGQDADARLEPRLQLVHRLLASRRRRVKAAQQRDAALRRAICRCAAARCCRSSDLLIRPSPAETSRRRGNRGAVPCRPASQPQRRPPNTNNAMRCGNRGPPQAARTVAGAAPRPGGWAGRPTKARARPLTGSHRCASASSS